MDHSYFKDRVSAYYDQDLPLQELELMRRHMAECDECQAMLAELAKLDQLIEQKFGLSDSTVYWEESARKIEARLSDKVQPAPVTDIKRSGWSGLWWKASSVAAAVLVVGFVALHRFEILDEAGQPGASQSTQPPAVRLEEKEAGEVRPDSLVPLQKDGAQTLATDQPEVDQRREAAITKPNSATPEESPAVQKTKKRQMQSLGAQAPAPAPQKTVPSDISVDVLDEKLLPDESLTVPEKSKTKQAPLKAAEGKVFIRGGRAGEVEYVVDGVKDNELAEKVDKVDSVPVINVQGEQSKETISRTAPQSELGEEVVRDKLLGDSALAEKLKVLDSAKTNIKGDTEFSAGGKTVREHISLDAMKNSLAPKQKDTTESRSNEILKQEPDSIFTVDEILSLPHAYFNSEGKIVISGEPDSSQLVTEKNSEDINFWERTISREEEFLSSAFKYHNGKPTLGGLIDSTTKTYDFEYIRIRQLRILRAHYEVCRLTDDVARYRLAYDIIREVANNSKSRISEEAAEYIKTLDSLNRFAK